MTARDKYTVWDTSRMNEAVKSDAELIGWSLEGDDDAFVEFVRRHTGAISSFVVRRVGLAAAEDVLSEVWIAAFRSRSTYDLSRPNARPWLFGVALNTVRRFWRTRPDEDLMPDVIDAPTVDPWPTVNERIDGRTALRDVLSRLRAEQREVLFLVVWEELSIAEAAEVLGIPATTARSHLHRARAALRGAPEIMSVLTEINTAKEIK